MVRPLSRIQLSLMMTTDSSEQMTLVSEDISHNCPQSTALGGTCRKPPSDYLRLCLLPVPSTSQLHQPTSLLRHFWGSRWPAYRFVAWDAVSSHIGLPEVLVHARGANKCARPKHYRFTAWLWQDGTAAIIMHGGRAARCFRNGYLAHFRYHTDTSRKQYSMHGGAHDAWAALHYSN